MTAPQRIPEHVLDEIRKRTPIAAIVGRRVKLERRGHLLCGCCPFHGERRPSFYVYPDHYHCFACGVHGDVIRFVMESEHIDFLAAVNQLSNSAAVDLSQPAPAVPAPAAQEGAGEDERAQRMHRYALSIFMEAQAGILGTPAGDYLAGRGIDLAELGRQPGALRYSPKLWHPWARCCMPAMVAAITGGDGSTHVATHCTWLERIAGAGWIKARVDGDRLVFGRFPGGSIHLWRGEFRRPFKEALADEPVVIGEGIETCLSIVVACPELRNVSGVNKAGMGKAWLPDQVRMVILAVDNDEARADTEQKRVAAARTLQRVIDRHIAAGRHVRIARAPAGKDFNDTLQDAA